MQKIEDETIAQKIRDKVNDFNAKSAIIVFAITTAYCALPLR